MITRLGRKLLNFFRRVERRETLAPLSQQEFQALRLDCLATGTPC
jgi:hypothetical protein